MTIRTLCLSCGLSVAALLVTGCGGDKTAANPNPPDPKGGPALTKSHGAKKDHDPYWNVGLTIAEQHDEAQTLGLLVMILASPISRDDFFGAPGDPAKFTSTDPLLMQLFNADNSHKVYTKVRDYMLQGNNIKKYSDYGKDFRANVFIPLSKTVLGRTKIDDDPYPNNICPSPATACDGSDGLGLPCIIP